jgi:hypothetical protein
LQYQPTTTLEDIMTTTATNIRTAADRIVARQPFSAGGNAYGEPNFRGGPNEGTVGALPRLWRDKFYLDVNAVDYVVYSYHTPIAWHTPDGWTIPDHKYSVSTSKHQSAVRYALL